jgi:hypothetical protein
MANGAMTEESEAAELEVGDVLLVAVDLERGIVWHGKAYPPPQPMKLTRRSRRRHRGRTRRVWFAAQRLSSMESPG